MYPEANPWMHLLLPDDRLHPTAFLRPDLVRHAFELWKSGKQTWQVHRAFALPDCTKFRPFVSLGVHHCMEFLKGWKITPEDTQFLRSLSSLSSLQDEFWRYLEGIPHFEGTVRGLPDGTRLHQDRVTNTKTSEGVALALPLVEVSGPAIQVALISEAFLTILDFCVSYSAMIVAEQGRTPLLWLARSERECHPLWASFATRIECVHSPDEPLAGSLDDLWLWCDLERDAGEIAVAKRAAGRLRDRGYEAIICLRSEST